MRTSTLSFALNSALLVTALSAGAERGVLKADGLLVVKGAELSTARVTIVPFGAPAYTLPVGTKRFVLHLPVNDYYLASFAREGCPTKEVYFDANVPTEYSGTDFDFPFMVTLEHMREDRLFEYEGPVGFVRYQHEIRDFGYETQYLVKLKEELRERMDAVQATGRDPKEMLQPSAMLVVDVPREGGERVVRAASTADAVQAPNTREVPRLVHPVVRDGAAPETPSVTAATIPVFEETMAVADPAPPSMDETIPAPMLAPDPEAIPHGTLIEAEAVLAAPVQPAAEMVNVEAPLEPVLEAVSVVPVAASKAQDSWVRQEETLTEQRRVTRIVRFIRADGMTQEYRRVEHAYGAVFFFHDFTSITERAFMECTAAR